MQQPEKGKMSQRTEILGKYSERNKALIFFLVIIVRFVSIKDSHLILKFIFFFEGSEKIPSLLFFLNCTRKHICSTDNCIT